MIVELISVGTELLLGNIVNTNAQYLAEKCALLGLAMYDQIVVGDNPKRLAEAFRTALKRSDVVILTGGLGPTEDDLTKEVCAEVMGVPLIEDTHTKANIEAFFKNNIYHEIPKSNWKQSWVPRGAKVLDNHNGTAPGLIIEQDNKSVILLPGPPNELYPLFAEQVYPYLQEGQPEIIRSQMVKICGVGESQVENQLLDLIDNQINPTIAPYAKTGEVHVRVTAKAANEDDAIALINPVVQQIVSRFNHHVYSIHEQETLEMAVVKLLLEARLTVTTAESCTGGMLAARIINVAGVSEVFKEGFITYSNQAKEERLGVDQHTLLEYGAVSEQTAKEMAIGGARAAASDVCLAITGVAGPGGGTDEKPVGLVYLACYVNNQVQVEEYHFKGNREKIREQTVVKALDLLRRTVQEVLWKAIK